MVIWLCGLSASGKTTIGSALSELLREEGRSLVFLDGDVLRDIWQDNLGYTVEARRFNASRISHLCRMLDRQGINVVAAVLYPFPEWMAWNRKNFSQYFEVFLDVPMSVLEDRDPKGLYASARKGETRNVVGVDIPFSPPKNPDMVIENGVPLTSPTELARRIQENLPRG